MLIYNINFKFALLLSWSYVKLKLHVLVILCEFFANLNVKLLIKYLNLFNFMFRYSFIPEFSLNLEILSLIPIALTVYLLFHAFLWHSYDSQKSKKKWCLQTCTLISSLLYFFNNPYHLVVWFAKLCCLWHRKYLQGVCYFKICSLLLLLFISDQKFWNTCNSSLSAVKTAFLLLLYSELKWNRTHALLICQDTFFWKQSEINFIRVASMHVDH